MNVNRVILAGRLTRDVELKYIPDGQQVAKLGLAINRRFKTRDGEQREEVVFVDCEAWGNTAETMAKYLNKGSPVFIEGRLKLDQWDQDGTTRSKLKVVIENFQFVGTKGESAAAPRSGPASPSQAEAVGHGHRLDDGSIPF